jgi:hypothetical protein
MPLLWRIPIRRSLGRLVGASPARSSRTPTPTTSRCPRRRAFAPATGPPSSLDDAFVLDGPGEYEVRDVLLTGVRTYRDDAKGADRGKQVAFLVELDGLHTIHLGEIGHLLTEEKLADIGPVDIACLPIGGSLSPTKAAELVSQLDPRIVVAMPLDEDASETREAVAKFFHEMGGDPTPQPKLSITISGLPLETTAVLLESRGKT